MKTRFNKIFSVLAVFFFCLTSFTAGAADLKSDLTIYYDVTDFGDFSGKKLQIMIGHNTYSTTYEMKQVDGYDNLYSVNIGEVNNGNDWGGATQLGFMAADVIWGGPTNNDNNPDNKPENRIQWAPIKTGIYEISSNLSGNISFTGSNTLNKIDGCIGFYVLRGIEDDWTTGIPLVVNDKNNNEVMLLNQRISRETDAVKVVYKNPCAESKYYGSVKLSSPVPYTFDDDGNIVLENGTYDFYFDKESKEIYIGGEVENLITVYLDPAVENGMKWTSDDALFAVYYYKSGPEPVQAGWVSAVKDDNGLYYAQFPATYDTYIWCRMKSDTDVNNWENRWNQTDKIAYDEDKPLTKLTSFGGPDKANDKAASYQMINCIFPAIEGEFPVTVHINQFVENDPCNYRFQSFEEAWEVLKQNKALCTVDGDAVTLKHPVEMLVTSGNEAYKGATEVHHTGGQVPATVIMFNDINPDGGEPLVITTVERKGDYAVLVHPVVRNCRNITFDRLNIVGDKDTKDNAMDIGVDMGGTVHNMENMALIPRPDGAEPSNITIQNCNVESWGRNSLHIVGAKGLHIENNEFFTHYDYTGTVEENTWAVDWGATIKFVNSTDIKFLRNSSEGTLATSLFIQGCKRILVMNNVFWNDNAVDFSGLEDSDRTVASVRLVTYNNDALRIENIGIYYNTFYIKDNEVGDGQYDYFDFFRLGGLMQNIDTKEERDAFNPEKIRFQYNNCYSYDDDIAGNNKDEDQPVKFYLQSFGKTDYNWCQSFKYNNFWSEYDKDQEEKDPNHVASNFEVGIFCTGENETYNAYIDMRGQVCATDPANPSALVVKGSGLNIGTVIIDDVSELGADKIFTDRLNGNAENPIRPTIVVDNSNESLSPSDHIYKEPGTIHFYTSPIVASQTTDVHVSSVALAASSKVYLSIVDGDVQYFEITDDAGQSLQTDAIGTYLATDNNGSLDNAPLFVTFKRPTGQSQDATFSAFLQIQPADDESLKLLIPLKGHNTVQVKDIKGAWTVGAFQQRESKPVKTIIWNGSESTDWDNRNNWYKEDGTVVTCLDVLDADLTVIIPSKNSENYVTPDGGIINYPTLPAISNEYDFKNARTNNWNGEQVNAGSNASASTTKVANKIYLEYGASLVGVEQLNSGVERYTEVEQEFTARRKDWLLVGSVVKPWALDDNGAQILDENGKPKTRDFVSGDYYLNHLPHVYMHEARIDTESGDVVVNWNETFAPLDVVVDPQKVFAVRLPNQYGPKKFPASVYNKRTGTNYDGDKPHTYSYKGRFYNESKLPYYEKLTPGKPVLLTNTYPANIDADELAGKGDAEGTFLIYDYDQESFVPVGGTDAVILSQHGFVFTPANEQLQIDKEYFLNNETGHRSLTDDILSLRLRVKNEKASVSSEVYISYDEFKEDKINYAVDAPKVFNGMVPALPDVYVMRYDKNWAGLSLPDITKPIPLGVKVSIDNQTFKFTLVDSNLPFDIILEDRQDEKTYNLSAGETCEVSDLVVGKCEGRFYINLKESLEEELPEGGEDVTTEVQESDIENSGIDIYTEGNKIVVSSTSDVELQTILISDISGRHQVYNVSGRYVTIDLPVSTGVYTIYAIGDKASRIEKLKLN